jgi:hypothetical protein
MKKKAAALELENRILEEKIKHPRHEWRGIEDFSLKILRM